MFAGALYQDLQELGSRLSQWTEHNVQEQGMIRPQMQRTSIVVGAKPISMTKIQQPALQISGSGTMPGMHVSSTSLHKALQKVVKYQTRLQDAVHAVSTALPGELTLWTPTDVAQSLLLLARHDLNALFAVERSRPCGERVLYNERVLEGSYSLFDAAGEFHVLFREAMHLMSPVYRSLWRLCYEYAHMACTMYGMTIQEFERTTRVCITRYAENGGEPLSLSSFARFERGPILVVILGEDTTLLDLCPAHSDVMCHATRLQLRPGTFIAIDGQVRLLCALGLPQEKSVRYKLTFLMSMEQSRVLDYSPVLRTPILARPMCKYGVVSEGSPIDLKELPHVYEAACDAAVHKLHERVLDLESRASVYGKTSSFAKLHAR